MSLDLDKPFWKREIPPTMTPVQIRNRLEALEPYLLYRRCGYKMTRQEAYCYLMEVGIQFLEGERKKAKEAERLSRGNHVPVP